ncbi:MAG: hypothetical protein KC652_26145 [Cyanobacteria bacterium HKST-UBA01]|nr:hypothetical protein [Cyanobacteria bacterium HKST-UBA01]
MIYYELYQGDFKDGLRVRLENLCYKLEAQIEEERRLDPAGLNRIARSPRNDITLAILRWQKEDALAHNKRFEATKIPVCRNLLLKPLDLKALRNFFNDVYKGKRKRLPSSKKWIIVDSPKTANQLALALVNLSYDGDDSRIRGHIDARDFPYELASAIVKKALDTTVKSMKLPAGQLDVEFVSYEFEYKSTYEPESPNSAGKAIKAVVSLRSSDKRPHKNGLEEKLAEIVELTRKRYRYMVHTSMKISPVEIFRPRPKNGYFTDMRGRIEWNNLHRTAPLSFFDITLSKAISEEVDGEKNGYYPTTLDDATRLIDHIGTFAWLYNDLVIVARPPVAVHFDDKGYPHSPDAHTPAIEYPDGWKIWADHGKIIKSARSC